MFTWICPQCGREVPPSYTECPDCAQKENQPAQPAAAAVAPPPQAHPESAAPQPAPAPQPVPSQEYAAAYRQPPPAPATRGGMPIWLMTIVFALAFLGLGAGIYWLVGYARNSGKPSITVENPAAKPGATVSPLQKYIEVSGVRFIENAKKQTEVRFVVVNHSPAEITGLSGNVTVWGRTRTSEEDAAGTFTFTTNLGPWESKELSAPLKSKLKIYELPDWQNVSTDIQITSPRA